MFRSTRTGAIERSSLFSLSGPVIRRQQQLLPFFSFFLYIHSARRSDEKKRKSFIIIFYIRTMTAQTNNNNRNKNSTFSARSQLWPSIWPFSLDFIAKICQCFLFDSVRWIDRASDCWWRRGNVMIFGTSTPHKMQIGKMASAEKTLKV